MAKNIRCLTPYFGLPTRDAGNERRLLFRCNFARQWPSFPAPRCRGPWLACDVPADAPRVAAAREWLTTHARWDDPQGIPQDHPEPWGAAVEFYHLAVRARVYEPLKMVGPWRDELTDQLAGRQHADGRFVNSVRHLMKEDESLLATTWALAALLIVDGR